MPFCVIPGCDTNVSGSTDITFHRLPKALVPLARWVVALGLGPLPRAAHVCSRHFEASMFTEHGTLTEDAVPKRILDIPLNNKPSPKFRRGSDEEEFSDSVVACRACLAADGRLYAISGSGLEHTLAALTGIAMPAEGSFPRHLCAFCMTKLSKCAAFRDSCQRSTKLLNSLSEKGLIKLNDIKAFKQKSNNLTLKQVCHFGTDSFIELVPIIKRENNDSSHEELEHRESGNIMKQDSSDVDNSTFETLIDNREKLKSKDSGIENTEFMKIEVEFEDTNVHLEIDNWIESEVANDASDVDTDTSEDTLITVKKRRKTGLNLKNENVVKCSEKNGNGKTEVDDQITNKVTDTHKETTSKKEQKQNTKKRKRDNICAFSCDLCGKNFSKESTLTAHKRGHGKTPSRRPRDPYLDMEKNYNFKVKILSKEEQRRKIEEVKFNRSTFGCDLCGKECHGETGLEAHKAFSHDSSLPLECDVCLYRFRHRRYLRQHRDRHRAVYTCRECGNVYRNRVSAKDHYLMHKGNIYKCPYCQKKYDRQCSYYSHVQLQHPDKNEPCDECGETFTGAMGLAVHKRTQHRTNHKFNPFKCKACDVIFLNAEALKKHEEVGTGVSHAALWPCAACGDSTGSEVALAAHAAEQHPPDQLYCKECDKTFSNASSFALHDERKHKNRRRRLNYYRVRCDQVKRVPVKRNVCEICGKLFVRLQQLESHRNGHLGIQPFQCTQCPKAFTNKIRLGVHMRVHTGEKPYQCEQCPVAFSHQGNFMRHVINVHQRVQAECELCGKTMAASSLPAHVRTVHMNQRYIRRKRTRTKNSVREES